MSRFEDRVDQIADTLADAAEIFRVRRDRLLAELQREKVAYDAVVLETEAWAAREKVIPSVTWTDDAGEPFLPVARLEVSIDPVPDLVTLFRERIATLRRELAFFARLLERRVTLPDEPLELAYAEVYGEVVYEASEVEDE